jgi:hypothetical protein
MPDIAPPEFSPFRETPIRKGENGRPPAIEWDVRSFAAALLGLLSCAVQPLGAQQNQNLGELERASEEFRAQTRNLGLRSDSPKKVSQGGIGLSQFHGRVFENFRNDFVDAVPHEIVQRGGTKNLLRRNQFGFNLSGPVIIPRLYNGARTTFISLSYEGVRERIARSYLRTVPTTPERTGDYTQVVDYSGDPLQIFDPATTRLNPNYDPSQPVTRDNLQYLRDPFPANRIPQERMDPVSRKMIAYYPEPNSNAGPFFRNNYFVVAPETNTADGMIMKVDHSFLEKHRVSVSGSFTNGFAGSAQFIPNGADSAPPDRQYANRRGSVEHVYTASPQSVNTATVEAVTDQSENQSDSSDYPEQLGLQGVPGKQFPLVSFSPYLNLGRQNPISRNARNTYILTDSHSMRRGKHSLRFTGQYVHYQVNTFVPKFPSGYFEFSSWLTSLPGIVNTGQGFASFLLGGAESAQVSLVPQPSYFRASRGVIAAQDTWEIKPGLTLNYGASVDISAPRTEKYDRQSTVDLSRLNPAGMPGALVAAGVDGQGRAFQPVRARFQPNAGLAWNPWGNRKHVVRLSYGRSSQPVPVYSGQWGTQGFNGYTTVFSPNVQLAPAMVLSAGVPPSQPLPDLRPTAANDTIADLVDRNGPLPTYQSASASYERELPASLVVSGGLSVAWGRDLFLGNSGMNPDAIPLSNLSYRDQLNNTQFVRSLSPYPQYLRFDVYYAWPGGRYRREAAFVRVEKRMSQGLSLNAYYEYSRQMDDYSGPYGVQDFYNRSNEWGLTSSNSPHRLSLSYQYELPFGAGKPLLAYSDWRRVLTGGWSISGITSVASGEPLALHPQFNNTGGLVQALRVNVVPGVDPGVSNQGPDLWFNPDAFSHPADFTTGDGPRTHPILRNPITQNNDLSVSKRFAIDAERTVELSAAGFNFLNHANWNDPDTVIGTPDAPNVNAGHIIGSRGGRVIQLSLRFSF